MAAVGVSGGNQTVVRFKTQVPCLVPAFYLINGKGVFALSGGLCRFLCLCVKFFYLCLCQFPGVQLPHKLAAFFGCADIQNVAYLGFPVLLWNVCLQNRKIFPAVAAGICVYLVNGFLFGLFLRRFLLRPDMRPL